MPEEIVNWRTTAEACAHLSISDYKLQRWIPLRGLRIHWVGHTMRFKFSEIDTWVRAAKAWPADRPQT